MSPSVPDLASILESLDDRARDLRVVEHHGQFVVLDGKGGPTYDGIAIGALAFSPDSRRLAYAARRGQHWRVVADGRESAAFDGIASLTFSPDSAHLAYGAQVGKSWRAVVDGHSGLTFDALLANTLVFGAGGHVAYVGTRGANAHAVVDNKVGPAFDGVASLAFGADGTHVGYLARRNDEAFAVVDGVVGPAYSQIDSLAVAAGRSGYIGRDRDGWHAVVDGVAGPAWDLARGIAFSSDSSHVAYAARRQQGETFVVVDGTPATSYTGIRPSTLRFAGAASQPSYTRERAISELVVAPRGGKVAYVAQRGANSTVIVDGREHTFDIVLDGTVVFDPTGTHWGCVAGVRAASLSVRTIGSCVSGSRPRSRGQRDDRVASRVRQPGTRARLRADAH